MMHCFRLSLCASGCQWSDFHPYLLGERAPLWDADAFGSLSVYSGNIQKRNDEGDSRRDLSQPLSDFKGVCQENQLTEIRATGGFAQSPIFVR